VCNESIIIIDNVWNDNDEDSNINNNMYVIIAIIIINDENDNDIINVCNVCIINVK